MNYLFRRFLPCLLLAVVTGCSTLENADYGVVQTATGIELTLDETPADCVPAGMVYSEQSGFYLLGALPMPAVDMAKCLRGLAQQAKRLGAHGVARIRMERETPSFFSMGGTPFPWMAWIQMYGQAYRRKPDGLSSSAVPK